MRVLASSVMLGGCVQATAYEQATSAAAVQAEGRRRLGEELAQKSAELLALRQERERLQAENARLSGELRRREGAMDQAELELVLAKQERTEEASLVQQLRGDLARVGSHLDVFADEKADLDAALQAARAENERLTTRLATAVSEPGPEQPEGTDAPADAAADEPADVEPAAAPSEPSPTAVSE